MLLSTIKEVAKRAGVYVGTVSKFINNIEVKPKTRMAIEAAIKELNYEPNIYARGLKMNRTNTIALILPTVWHPFFSELAYNIEKNLRALNYKMILCNSEGDYKIELDYITMAKQNQVDGIIAITYSDIEAFISSNLPMVSVDRFFNEEITYVSSDNLMGGYLAAQKLIESGCQSICFIGEGSKKDNSTRNRKKGFINYCEEHRIDYQVCEMLGDHDKFDETLKQFLMDNLIQQKKIDGIFTVTDAYAYFIIEKLKEYHLSVPEDVQIIGFDGAKSSKKSVIEISTIRQPIELIAKHTVESIDALINKQTIEKEIILPVEFHQGSTTKH